jgi:hypothetical protein
MFLTGSAMAGVALMIIFGILNYVWSIDTGVGEKCATSIFSTAHWVQVNT